MTRRARTAGSLGAALFALVATIAAPASAQEDDAYHRLVADAVSEFEARRFEEARALFRQAHELSPNARTLRGIGLASFEMRDYREAYRAIRAALGEERRPLTEEQRASATELLESTRRFLGVYEISVEPSSATVRVDGAPAALEADGHLLLSLGRHTVSATADGHRPAEVVLRVSGGEQEPLTLTLEPVGSEAAGAEQSSSGGAPASGEGQPRDRSPPIEAIAVLIGGGVVSAAAVVVGLTWWLDRQLTLDECGTPSTCTNTEELRDFRDAAAGTTLSLATLGAAGLVVGAVLLGTAGGEEPRASWRCAPSGLGLICAGRF